MSETHYPVSISLRLDAQRATKFAALVLVLILKNREALAMQYTKLDEGHEPTDR